MKALYAVAVVAGIAVHLLFNLFFFGRPILTPLDFPFPLEEAIAPMDCLLFTLGIGVVYFHAGLILGTLFPDISWKGGLWLLAPGLFLFVLGCFLSVWILAHFEQGNDVFGAWGSLWEAISKCDKYRLPTQILAAVLGSFMGSLIPIRKKGLSRRSVWLRSLLVLGLCVFSGSLFALFHKSYSNRKDPIQTSAPVRKIAIAPAASMRIGAFEYKTIRVGHLLWMAENLNHDTRDTSSRCYADHIENCRAFGRLYTWEGAMNACADAGWRLPTKAEWEMLIHNKRNGKDAFHFLSEGGKSGFNARLGGSYQPAAGAFANLGEVGGYWSSTSNPDNGLIWKCGFRKNGGFVWNDYFPRDWYFSCRCVKEAPNAGR